jgi:hypothetical protein
VMLSQGSQRADRRLIAAVGAGTVQYDGIQWATLWSHERPAEYSILRSPAFSRRCAARQEI